MEIYSFTMVAPPPNRPIACKRSSKTDEFLTSWRSKVSNKLIHPLSFVTGLVLRGRSRKPCCFGLHSLPRDAPVRYPNSAKLIRARERFAFISLTTCAILGTQLLPLCSFIAFPSHWNVGASSLQDLHRQWLYLFQFNFVAIARHLKVSFARSE